MGADRVAERTSFLAKAAELLKVTRWFTSATDYIAYRDERNSVFSRGFESMCIVHWINRKRVYKRAQPSPFNDAQNNHTP